MSQAKPTHYPDLTAKLEATPADIHGALKENAYHLLDYLNKNAWMQLECHECKKHLDRMIHMFGQLNNMQATLQAAMEANAEAQATAPTKQ